MSDEQGSATERPQRFLYIDRVPVLVQYFIPEVSQRSPIVSFVSPKHDVMAQMHMTFEKSEGPQPHFFIAGKYRVES